MSCRLWVSWVSHDAPHSFVVKRICIDQADLRRRLCVWIESLHQGKCYTPHIMLIFKGNRKSKFAFNFTFVCREWMLVYLWTCFDSVFVRTWENKFCLKTQVMLTWFCQSWSGKQLCKVSVGLATCICYRAQQDFISASLEAAFQERNSIVEAEHC